MLPRASGGLERVVQGLAIGHAKRGHEVRDSVLTSEDQDDDPLLENLREAGVGVDVIRERARAYLRQRRMLEKLIRQIQPCVVHSHGYHADVVGASAARRAGIRALSTAHGFTGGGLRTAFMRVSNERTSADSTP